MKRVNLEIVGVGGQGILTSSQVLGAAALERDLDVYMSEVHGMAQRGGVVVTTVKIGEEVYSPLIGKGDADVILGFEPIETYRAIEQASKKTWIVTNEQPIVPFTVSVGTQEYPSVEEKILPSLEKSTDRLITLKAEELAKEAGASITQNIVMLGALSATEVLPINKDDMMKAVEDKVPERFVEMNLAAFEKGFDKTRELIESK
ncbi:MAG: indolepyruvate ferredoxin oxidoreductase subunit beta [Candidatus Thermoplasmatota archaeon]|nr:indolepyruvate ferredoxin oxidoreductase subunit beta [Candidatus Thermoplasmatota archaeon]MBS3789476.1 indolepyruvate ferredoxin oxidoreductase subunit beta [Candidatus Thermoplasmatota archaeon]